MFTARKINIILLSVVAIVYCALFVFSIDFCYFWDTIQQISKEGYWFYKTNFASLLIHPVPGLNIEATGYHPPLMGMMTALLWKLFGYKLWVSHAFTFLWAILLIYTAWKLVCRFFPEKWRGFVLLILLFESTVLTQFVIASPDFILFTAFAMALRAIFERKNVLLSFSLIFLCGVSMRGVFAGAILFIANLYYDYLQNDKKYSLRLFGKTLLPYLPIFFILLSYYVYYFFSKGWFFINSNYSEHYLLPNSIKMIAAHLAEFILRLVENGRFFVWLFAFYFTGYYWLKNKQKILLSNEEKMLGLFLVLISGLYFLFVFITRMPFCPRYFIPLFFVLSILTLQLCIRFFTTKKLRIVFGLLLVFTLTGHFWIYPEKIAKPWETTLLHTPYYQLRKECFDYIDKNGFNYSDLSAGFCLYGNRGRIELTNEGKIVGNSLDTKYFIYSNISNLEDEKVDELKDIHRWTPIKTFRRGVVFITIYQKNN